MGPHCWKYDSYFVRSSALILQSPRCIISIFILTLLVLSYLPFRKPFCYLIIKINSNKKKKKYSYVNIYNKCSWSIALSDSRSNFLEKPTRKEREKKKYKQQSFTLQQKKHVHLRTAMKRMRPSDQLTIGMSEECVLKKTRWLFVQMSPKNIALL